MNSSSHFKILIAKTAIFVEIERYESHNLLTVKQLQKFGVRSVHGYFSSLCVYLGKMGALGKKWLTKYIKAVKISIYVYRCD